MVHHLVDVELVQQRVTILCRRPTVRNKLDTHDQKTGSMSGLTLDTEAVKTTTS